MTITSCVHARLEPEAQLLAYRCEQSRLFIDTKGRDRVSIFPGPLQIDVEYAVQVTPARILAVVTNLMERL